MRSPSSARKFGRKGEKRRVRALTASCREPVNPTLELIQPRAIPPIASHSRINRTSRSRSLFGCTHCTQSQCITDKQTRAYFAKRGGRATDEDLLGGIRRRFRGFVDVGAAHPAAYFSSDANARDVRDNPRRFFSNCRARLTQASRR